MEVATASQSERSRVRCISEHGRDCLCTRAWTGSDGVYPVASGDVCDAFAETRLLFLVWHTTDIRHTRAVAQPLRLLPAINGAGIWGIVTDDPTAKTGSVFVSFFDSGLSAD